MWNIFLEAMDFALFQIKIIITEVFAILCKLLILGIARLKKIKTIKPFAKKLCATIVAQILI